MNISYVQTVAKELSAEQIVQLILKKREIQNLDEYFRPTSPLLFQLKTFGYEKQGKKLMSLLYRVWEKNERVVVYTDYDADGITGGAVMWETLHLLGFDVMPYVPDRKTEGYGFSKIGIDKVIKEFDPKLIISVDHGITAVDEIAYAKEQGIGVVVTDHHHKQEKAPKDAEVIIHIPQLSGSGVAYVVAKEIYQHFRDLKNNKTKLITARLQKLEQYFRHDYQAIATIGLVADLVPLKDYARAFVFHGLLAFRKVKRTGITSLLKQAGIENKPISPYEIGFIIAPRINVVGRLENAIDALRLLCTTNKTRSQELAEKLGVLNTKRQDMVKTSVEEAKKQVKERYGEDVPPLIILYSSHWNEGIIGLIASALVEEYYRPTIVMTQNDTILKASARSIPAFHITNFFEELSEWFINFGGHAQAAGFSILKEKRDAFIAEAHKKARKAISDSDLVRSISVDMQIPLTLVTKKLVETIDTMAPFGIGNSRPKFASTVTITDAKLLGKDKNHLKITIEDLNQKTKLDCIGFGMGEMFQRLSSDEEYEIVYTIDLNRWNGNVDLQLKLVHLKLKK